MEKKLWMCTTLLLSLTLNVALTNAQSRNLLQNTTADMETRYWRAMGEAAVESTTTNNLCFVVRNGGYFYQDVILPNDAVGQYAVLIGRGSSQRINPDGAITGLPSLYGYMMAEVKPNGGQILEYLQGQRMLSSPRYKDEWVDMWGTFLVPEGTRKIRFFLNQALRSGVPHNGSAAAFDSLGLYLFPRKEDAEAFVDGNY